MKQEESVSEPVKPVESVSEKIEPNPSPAPEPTESATAFSDAPPAPRTVIHAPALKDSVFPEESEQILIKAQPSPTGDQCMFTVNRVLMADCSWYFDSFESAAESSLAESLFSLDDVETVLVCESTVTVTRKDKTLIDWVPLAKEIGGAIRGALEEGRPLIAEKIISSIPTEEVIRAGIQKVIDEEVNPGVAGHGGQINLLSVKGNSVTIQMGGGCQGCSAADLTLKQGIHTSFRKAVPEVGAIFDETDHTAGLNPYFS
ncbi:MAG: NifU family protein [Nitrospinota bacterium]